MPMFQDGDNTDVIKSIRANATTNLEPGFSDTLMKDCITIALPKVPDMNMNKQSINIAMSLAEQARRKASGLATGAFFKSAIFGIGFLAHIDTQNK